MPKQNVDGSVKQHRKNYQSFQFWDSWRYGVPSEDFISSYQKIFLPEAKSKKLIIYAYF